MFNTKVNVKKKNKKISMLNPFLLTIFIFYCLISYNNCIGVIMRQSKTMTADNAAKYAAEMMKLTQKARHVVRDLDPKVSTISKK